MSNIDATDVLNLKVGERLPISVSSGKSAVLVEGVIEFISPVIDAASGLRRVKLLINNRDGRVVPGSPATLGLDPVTTPAAK